mmetsp:Transcript_933/g.2302  ORF Transcript_933/g.2302 Transcript_933/m.2302 type:complete len:265 (+) Transcript_933:1862-2656(+)
MSNMRVVVKSPSLTMPCSSMKMLSGFRLRCITPWWCTCERPDKTWRNFVRISTRRSLALLPSRRLNQAVKLSCTNSVHIATRLPRTSTPKCLMTLGCCSLDSNAASRKKDVGTPSSLPAFVSSRSTMRRSAGSPVPKRLPRKSRPLERRSTIFSETRSWSSSRTRGRRVIHSSLPWAMSRHGLHAGAARSIRSRTPSQQKTSYIIVPGCRSSTREGDQEQSSVPMAFTSSATPSMWFCFLRFVGDNAGAFQLMTCKGFRCVMGV